jgi:predicted AAA+ superfamily ATPase
MFTSRKIYAEISGHVARKEYTVITGARQSGKSTILQKLYADLQNRGENVFYLSFENPDVLKEANGHPENIFKFAERPANPLLQSNPEPKRIFLLIDEIQYLSDPSGFMKYLFDTYLNNLKLIVTGSSAFYMDNRFKDSMAGRKRIFLLETLDFEEFLLFRNMEPLQNELRLIRVQKDYKSVYEYALMDAFSEFLVFGGYPAVVLENDIAGKKAILTELRNSFIRKDILEAGIGNETAFYHLMMLLAGQTGNLVNKSELSATLRIDLKTVENYLYIMQKCFHIALVKPFFNNLRKELVKMPKVFFNDNGLRNVMLNRFLAPDDREDKGALLENYVFQRLASVYGREPLYYWRTTAGNEVDFIVREDNLAGKAIEVKFSKGNKSLRNFRQFQLYYPSFDTTLLTFRPENDATWVLKI